MTLHYAGKCYPCRRTRCQLCTHTEDTALADYDAITHVHTHDTILRNPAAGIPRALSSKSLKDVVYYETLLGNALPTFSVTLQSLRMTLLARANLTPLAQLTNLTALAIRYDNEFVTAGYPVDHVLPRLPCSIVDLSIRFRTYDIDAQTMDVSSISSLSRLTQLNAARVFVRDIALPSTITHLTDECSDFSITRLAQSLPALKYIKSDYSGELTLSPTATLREYLVDSPNKMLKPAPSWANSLWAEGYSGTFTPIANIPHNTVKLMYRGKFADVYTAFNLPELCKLDSDIDDIDLALVASHFPKLCDLVVGPVGWLTSCNIRIDSYMAQITTLRLNLSRQECDIDLKYVPNLRKLVLNRAGCDINPGEKKISLKGLTHLVELQILFVICADYEPIYDNTDLEEITLIHCGDLIFDNRIAGLTKLRRLCIRYVDTLKLPDCIGYMQSLRTVNIDNIGQLLYIPQSICRLMGVAELSIAESRINTLTSMHAAIATTACLDVTKAFASAEAALAAFNAPICPDYCTCIDHFLDRVRGCRIGTLPRDVIIIILAYATERICDRMSP